MITVARHELLRLFKTPLAWIILAVIQFLVAQLFLKYWEIFELRASQYADIGVTEVIVGSLFQTSAIILLLCCPFITMRSFSDEKRLGTMSLLLSSPVSLRELVLGKFIGIYTFFLILVFLITLMPLSLGLGTSLDYWQVGAAVLAMGLLVSSFVAIGIFISSLCRSASLAAITTFGILFLLWIISLAANSGAEEIASVLRYLSLLSHFNSMLEGLIHTSDICYYLVITISFLLLTIWRLDAERVY